MVVTTPTSPFTSPRPLPAPVLTSYQGSVGAKFNYDSDTATHSLWDLRNKCEVVALAYGRAGQVDIIGDGGRKGMSGVTWHPDNVS